MRFTRRTMLAAMPLAAACSGAARVPVLHVAPGGEGDGGSWESAARLIDLDDLIGRVAPGGEVLLAADRGVYELADAIEVASGGRPGRRVRVRGVNSLSGEAQMAALRGSRGGDEQGADGFRLLRGANYLHFSHLSFEHFGNGCIRAAGPISDLTIEDCAFDTIYRFFENTASDDASQASIRSFVLRRCSGGNVERGFARIRYGSSDGLIEDCHARGLPNEQGYIPAGCALDDEAHTITLRRVVMENFQQWRAGDYWNGDGFSDESENYEIVYEACEARGSTDGGFDCKSRDVVLRDCIAEDNKRNFRVWSERARLERCTSRNPNFRGATQETASACHVWIGHDEARVRIDSLTVVDQTAADAIIEFEHEGARVEIHGLTVDAPRENWGEAGDRAVIVSR
ncbi:MAG: hypothetical protein K2X34_03020 [Hyphomonadaceae bacterium]|nr:hypothetical protein [Hyphomonadaceae bacterium]